MSEMSKLIYEEIFPLWVISFDLASREMLHIHILRVKFDAILEIG